MCSTPAEAQRDFDYNSNAKIKRDPPHHQSERKRALRLPPALIEKVNACFDKKTLLALQCSYGGTVQPSLRQSNEQNQGGRVLQKDRPQADDKRGRRNVW